MISGYNTGYQPVKVFPSYLYFFSEIISTFPQNLVQIIFRSINVHGLSFIRHLPKYAPQFYAEISAKVASGEIQHREHVYDGLAKAGEAILAQQKGSTSGKAIVHVGDE